MNAEAAATAGAVTFVWLGMVLAISFIEAPLKFRAPGVTVPIGLAIGRLVFRALNLAEAALALMLIATVAVGTPTIAVVVLTAITVCVLAAQLAVVRPRLNRRSDRVLAGENLPRSTTHLYYIALEATKLLALISLGVALQTV
ncbi:hypothetical protein OG909_14385 [Streptomyces sp. NBC_01754]|uniref:hypothetical protein n=1 Tax=Streptomyces sp. NBC_01754 TaxID=2975930 RepID=UPI002DD7AEDB|nr:hypothetical protein [Streptomyces sp. NBC_01754]WSC93373.1 hypothetical protein OG909_14385 [Streptomyces sp. NBC_01754]